MAMDTVITGSNLDTDGNVKVALPLTPSKMGGVRIFSEEDDGTLTGTPYLRSPETSQDYRLRVGMDTILFDDSFNGTAQNTSKWYYAFNTLTAAQPGAGTVNFSAVQGTTNAHGAYMRTWRPFSLVGTAPLAVDVQFGQFTAPLVSNEVWLCGLGSPSAATTPPTDGVWLQLTTAGLIGVLNFNGTITQSGVLMTLDQVILGEMHKYTMVIGEGWVSYWYEDILIGKQLLPASNGQPFLSTGLPFFMMKYNTGAVSNTNTMRVSDVNISIMDIQTAKPWSHQQSGMGNMISQTLNGTAVSTPTAIVGATLTTPNTATAAAAALVNISAATQFTGLGGVFQVLPTLTAGTDGILCSYQNPAGTVNIQPRELYITGVYISGGVAVALTGGPLTLAYTLAYGSTAATLATAETASFATGTTKLSRRVPLGIQSAIVTAAAGTPLNNNIAVQFQSPIVVNPGEFLQVVVRNLGTVTTAGSLAIAVTFDGYFA